MQSAANNESKTLRIAQTVTTDNHIEEDDRIRSIIDEWLVPVFVKAFLHEPQPPSTLQRDAHEKEK